MAYAIMRCKKLKGMGGVSAALKHCFRERETANADPSLTLENEHYAAQSTSEAMGKMRELLPEKRRKDAVLAVEYLCTASPEWWKQASPQEQAQFFRTSEQWLVSKYGRENIIAASIHRDETSPHLSAFVVPITKDKRLSAKEFIGDRHKMSEDQTSFASAMRSLGLERGLEGSKAHHTTIREYYARARAATPSKTPTMDLPEPKLLETKSAYGVRVADAVFAHVKPELVRLRARAQQTDLVENKVVVAEQRQHQAEQIARTAQRQADQAQQEAAASLKKCQAEAQERSRVAKQHKDLIRTLATMQPEELQVVQQRFKENLLTEQQKARGKDKGMSR